MKTLVRYIPSLLAFIGSFWLTLTIDSREQLPAEPSGALQALTFWTESRAYPQNDIPADAYYREYVAAKSRIPPLSQTALGTTPWRSIGPTNFAGRMIGLALNPLNPNTIYAGSASGGVWRSYTGGSAGDWQRIMTGFPVLGVNAIAIDPTDTNVIYIGTGEVYRYQGSIGGVAIRTTRGSYGMGILKSTDNGVTWTKSLDWSYNQQRGVQAIRLNPQNPRTIIAATSEGIYRSTNAGATWDSVLSVLMASDIAIHPLDTTLILITAGNFASPGNGIYRSTDGGSTFVRCTDVPSFNGMARLAMYAANPNIVYAHLADSTVVVGSIYKTTNFGASWMFVSSNSSSDVQGWYSRFLAVHPTNSNILVLGAQRLWKSTNGGVSFSQVAGGWYDFHEFAQHPLQANTIFIADDGGVWRSTNFGDTYAFVGQGLLTSQFYNGFSNSATDSLRALGQTQDHFGWMYVGSPVWPRGGVDEVGWTAINPQNDFIMYAGNRNGGAIYKSTDRGWSFFHASSGITSGLRSWNTPFVLSPSDPNVLYFGRSIVYKTTNAATNWTATNSGTPIDVNPPLAMAISATSPDTLIVGTAPLNARPRYFRTANGGATWTDITGILPDRYPMDLAIDPRNSRTFYAAIGGFGTGRLFKSTDAGTSWTDVTGLLPDVPTTAIAIDPLNTSNLYVGTDIGVYISTDAGASWNDFNEGLPEALIVADLTISPSNRYVRLASHSNGVFERPLLETPVGVRDGETAISEFRLEQNYPNPFNPLTNIGFEVKGVGFVSLKVYNSLGQEVATLVNEVKQPGRYTVSWNASGVPSGVYLYRLTAGTFVSTRKMLLMK